VAGKKKKEKTAGQPEEEEDDDYPDLDIRPERWVNLRVKFVTWNFLTGLDFGMKVRTSTRLNAIVDKIKDRYGGSIMDVILYRHEVERESCLPWIQRLDRLKGVPGRLALPPWAHRCYKYYLTNL